MQAKILLPLLALSFQFINPCSPQNKPTRTPSETDTVYDVKVTCLDIVGVPRTHDVSGEFEPSEVAVVTASVTSEVTQVLVEVGDTVVENDPVVMLSGADLQTKLDLLKAQSKEIDARLKKAQGDFKSLGKVEDRPVTVDEAKFLDEEDFATPPPEPKQYGPAEETKKPNTLRELVDVLTAMSERYAKKVEVLEKQLADLTQKSPVNGIVTKVHASAKNHVDERTALLEISRTDPMSVVFALPEDVASFVDKHSTVTVSVVDEPRIAVDGTVYFIDPNIDTTHKTITMKAHVTNPKNLIKGGQKANVIVSTRKVDESKFVDKKALVFEKKKVLLYYVEMNQARVREIRAVGKEDKKGRMEVEVDLSNEDPIILDKPEGLMNGSFVKILPEYAKACDRGVSGLDASTETDAGEFTDEATSDITGSDTATSTAKSTGTGKSGVQDKSKSVDTTTGDVPGGGY